MVSLASRLRVVFVLLFLFVLGLPPVHAVDVNSDDSLIDVSRLDDSVLDSDVNNVDSDSLVDSNFSDGTNSDSGVGLVIENNNNNNNVDSVSVDSVSGLGSVSGVPSVLGFSVSGDFDRSKRGVGFYKNVRVQVTGENFTGDNFLSKEGLHWSDKTRVEPITARKLGVINDPVRFFPQNTPNKPVDAYSMNNGDSGRITFVGKTQSNIDLDIIWTVSSSDKNAWISGSGFNNDGKTKGLGFTGEQYMPNSTGNSIVVLYNQANTLGLHYKIVKHGTMEEVPVLVSFISTDIDAGQGVDTDLDNITRIVPPESNLKIDNNLVYDSTPGVVGLNGSNDLPKGGYIGVGFVSSFNYTFFSPAPKRANEYQYSSAVRYDIFGSSLQANVDSRIIQNLQVSYVTQDGMELSETRLTSGFVGDAITSEELAFDGYTLVEKKEDYSASSYPKIVYVYKKDAKQVTPTKPNNPTTPNNPVTPTKPTNPSKPSNPTTQPVRPQTTTPPRTVTRVPQTYVPRTLSPHTPPRQSQHLINKTTPKKQDKGPKVFVKKSRFGSIPIDDKTAVCNMFCKNTGILAAEEKRLREYLKDIKDKAVEKFGSNKAKVDKFIADSIAYESYYNNDLETMVNDFTQVEDYLDKKITFRNFTKDMHDKPRYLVDPAHEFMSISTTHFSSDGKEITKFIAALNPFMCVERITCYLYFLSNAYMYNDIFYLLNSDLGDRYTNNNLKDQRSNKDSYIILNHPDFKGMYVDDAWNKLYYNYDLNAGDREKLFEEAKNSSGDNGWYYWIVAALGSISLGSFALRGKKIWDDTLDALENNKGEAKAGQMARGDLGKIERPTIVVDRVYEFGRNIKSAVVTGYKLVKDNVIKPVLKFVNNKLVKPVKNFVKNKVVKPVVKTVKKAVRTIKNNVIKPVTKFMKNKVVAPVKNFFKKIFKPSNTKTRPRKSSKNVKKGRR